MRLIAELRVEHDLIDACVGAFRTWIERYLAGAAGADDGPRFVGFFRVYAAGFHHAREEDVLFRALVQSADLPEAGPIAALREDHRRTGAVLARIEVLVSESSPLDDSVVLATRAFHPGLHGLPRRGSRRAPYLPMTMRIEHADM